MSTNGASPAGAKRKSRRNGSVRVNLALQGGGSHGAFTWGVLDCLLEDGRFEFPAISGTSAGAMNAVAMAHGYCRDGAEGARQSLHDFWRRVGLKGRLSPIQRNPWDVIWGNWSVEHTVGFNYLEAISRSVSPALANPLGINPVKEALEAEVDFDRIAAECPIDLFIGATNVETGELRLFTNNELDGDVLAASSCLPMLFPPVEIDGEAYWDGGFGGNPPIYPLRHANDDADILLIQINPIVRRGVPRSARAIQNRVDEITFNASLLNELREIVSLRQLIADGRLDPSALRAVRMHRIDGDSHLEELHASSKISAEWEFLRHLRDLGRAAARDWLDVHGELVGKEETMDLPSLYMPGRPGRSYRKSSTNKLLIDRIRNMLPR